MKFARITAVFAVLFGCSIAQAQTSGSVTNHAFAVGKGAGVTGYTSLLCTSAQLAVGQAAADPICQTITGDVTISAGGVTAIGSSIVHNSMLNSDVFSASVTLTNKTINCANNTCTVRLGSDVTGNLPLSNLVTGSLDQVIGYFGATAANAIAINNCTGALTYSTTTHTFGCNAAAGTGTVTSIAAGTGISVSPSPITTTGTITNTGVVTVKKQVFTLSGTYTPSAGMLFAMIDCVGGGGGGGGVNGNTGIGTAAGGGGSGGYSKIIATAATIGASQTVTIGAAGAAGTAGNAGGAGSATSVGSVCIANGGAGGAGNLNTGVATASGGAGGSAGTGDLTAAGAPGGPGGGAPNTNPVKSGFGGNSFFGGGALGNIAPGTACFAGAAAGNYGSGGSGAVCNNTATATAGGAGSKGVVYITEYNSQ